MSEIPPSPETAAAPRAFPGPVTVGTLGNGLTVACLDNPQAPVVGLAVWVRAGTRHEPAGHGGLAHFLEHLMFQGSRRFGPGEHDRRIRALGGDDNALTSHDATAYLTTVAADRWHEVLALEADRMAGLRLDGEAVDRERQVICAELAMYDDDPWDSLSRAVDAALYGDHPYARPILGTREELEATGAAELREFHRRRYHPANAVLAVAGRIESADRVLEAAAAAFGDLPAGKETGVETGADSGASARPSPENPRPARITREHPGSSARLLLALPAPGAGHPDHPALHLLSVLLAHGHGSRLVGGLVDDGDLCGAVAAELSCTPDPGALTIAAEALPGVEPDRIEDRIRTELDDLRRTPPRPEETTRARETALAEWVFGHQRVAEQAMALGSELCLFSRSRHQGFLDAVARRTAEDLTAAARRWLDPDHAVIAWSLPEPRCPSL